MKGPEASREGFARHLKPRVFQRLHAAGLDVEILEGRGDTVRVRHEDGSESDVLDMVGGFGAGLLGHNNPALVKCMQGLLADNRAFLAQATVRGAAGRLAQRLSDIAEAELSFPVVSTLTNSGAEAVEAAIKHAEMERLERAERIDSEATANAHRARIGLRDGTLTFDRDAASKIVGRVVTSYDDLEARVTRSVKALASAAPVFLALQGSFHGKTTGALQLTYLPAFREPWRHIGPDVRFLPVDAPEAAHDACRDARRRYLSLVFDQGRVRVESRYFCAVAAAFAEPIQGEGGVRTVPEAMFESLRQAADEHGFPVVSDEIQCGLGRTGRFFAAPVRADYTLLGKSLGGGLTKIAALCVDSRRYLPELGYLHSSTHAEDDHASEIALEVLRHVTGDGIARVNDRGRRLRERLEKTARVHPHLVREIRGRGLMLGVSLAPPRVKTPLVDLLCDAEALGLVLAGWLLRERRVRVLTTLSSPWVLRVQPSLLLSDESIETFAAALEDGLALIEAGDIEALVRHLVPDAAPPTSQPTPARRPAPVPAGSEPRKVAFLAHFLHATDLGLWEPRLGHWPASACHAFLQRTHRVLGAFEVARQYLRSARGSSVDIHVIGLPFTPELALESLRTGERAWLDALIAEALDQARSAGCDIVGFGGYTSIVTSACRDIVRSDLTVTSGNSLTAGAGLAATFATARELELGDLHLGVVGALGNIGAVMAELAVDQVQSLTLLTSARGARRLEPFAAELRARGAKRVQVATEPTALCDCNVIVSATNSARPVIEPEHLATTPVVLCDVAVPGDASPRIFEERPATVVLAGGSLRAPGGQSLSIEGMALSPGTLYGCLAETALLGMAESGVSPSVGPLVADKVRAMTALAAEHGFTMEANRVHAAERSRE